MRTFVVDSFNDIPFTGNPAGVVLLDSPAEDAWMQSVAHELQHPETAFVVGRPHDEPKPLRWFTPTEVNLCDHATLAAAHVLGGDQRFDTRSGILTCTTAQDGRIELDFPVDRAEPIDPPDGLAEVPAHGVITTAPGDREGVDFVSRYFAPRVGIPEDPVTGSAHCTLVSWWSAKLGRTEHGSKFTGEQAAPRGGVFGMVLRGTHVGLRGRAVTVLEGELWA